MSGLPYGWQLKESKSRPGVVYYIHNGKTQWTEPSEKQIQAAKREAAKNNKRTRTDSSSSSSSSSSSNNKRAKMEGKVRASHILVKHIDSRNPSSWRQEGKIVRTEQEANERLSALRKNVVDSVGESGESNGTTIEQRCQEFAAVAQIESDCSSYKRGGDLNYFAYDKMDPAFSAVSFHLKYGEISQPFKSASGVHIVIRTDDPEKKSTTTASNSSSGTSSGGSQVQQVQVLHILKKHIESRRPVREGKAITRTKEEATNEIKELLEGLQQIATGSDCTELESTFRQFATNESDCSSRRAGGDLGLFEKGKMQPSFEAASFSLAVGGLSAVVETASGIHIILRVK